MPTVTEFLGLQKSDTLHVQAAYHLLAKNNVKV